MAWQTKDPEIVDKGILPTTIAPSTKAHTSPNTKVQKVNRATFNLFGFTPPPPTSPQSSPNTTSPTSTSPTAAKS
ncbi:MAG: hypothetical protein WCW01_00455 [Gammaproteobacteria bacterium]|jgi:hypothetical protein